MLHIPHPDLSPGGLLYCCTAVLHSNAALVGHPMWSQGHIHTSSMLGGGVSMVVIMSHVIGYAVEWFPHVGDT